MTVGEKIAELLDWSGVSQGELSKRTGIPQSTISSYVTERASIPVEAAFKIAEGLDISPWMVINHSPLPATPLELTDEEQEIITDMRHLSRHQQEVVIQSIKLMRRQNSEKGMP